MNQDTFFNDLEDLYKTHSIYRAIVVTDINKQSEMKSKLDKYDHTSFIIYDDNFNIDYEKIDYRVVIIDYNLFKSFIDFLYNKNDVYDSSFNLIAFSYDIDLQTKKILIDYIHKLSILDSNTTIM